MSFFLLLFLKSEVEPIVTRALSLQVRTRLVHWLLAHSVAPGSSDAPVAVADLAKSLQDGALLLAVLHHFSPEV